MKKPAPGEVLELFGPQHVASTDSPIGRLWIESDGQRIIRLSFESPGRGRPGESKVLKEAVKQLQQYFNKKRKAFKLPIAEVGSPFRKALWEELNAIPFGRVKSYQELAEVIGGNARAVGGACADNPVPIIVPCHRVLASNGLLTGYLGGIWRKRWLLEHEGVLPKELFSEK